MNKMTVIQLLNKIANGEEVPMLIKWNDDEWYYTNNISKTYSNDKEDLFSVIDGSNLNDEVEILEEEKKIPEKLEEFGLIQYSLDYIDYKNIETLKEWLNKDFQTIYDTLDLIIKNQNKLIDFLKSKGE